MKRPLKRSRYTNQMAFAVWKIRQSHKELALGMSEVGTFMWSNQWEWN